MSMTDPSGPSADPPSPPPPAPPPVPPRRTDPAVVGAFAAGWLVAQLHRSLLEAPSHAAGDGPLGLPSAGQLNRSDGVKLAIRELDRLVQGPLGPSLRPGTTVTGIGAPDDAGYDGRLLTVHTSLLEDLTFAGHQHGAAYSLGTSLAHICSQPESKEHFQRAFAKQQLAVMQGWLNDIAGSFASACTTQVVSQSLDHWSAWLAVDPVAAWTSDTLAIVQAAVRQQGEHWRALLSGEMDPASGVGPSAWIQAGQAALRRASAVARGVVARFWVPIAVILAVTAGAVFLGIHYGRGTARVWTSLLSAGAGLGLTGKSVQSGLKRLASSHEKPLVDLAEVDAMSWAATWLPDLPISRVDAYRLRSTGTSPPRRAGRSYAR
ncbi:MAG: hypothetical protein ACRDXE_04745 [Acidimicrobiales bacterium]